MMGTMTSTGISGTSDATTAAHPIILFDGVCNYCNSILNYIIKHDHKKRFRYAHLQSKAGQDLLEQYGFPRDMLDTVVLIENGNAYIKTDVTARVAPHLSGIAKLGVVLRIIPRAVRDFGYDIISRNRYKWWGKQDTCIMPTPDVRERFLA